MKRFILNVLGGRRKLREAEQRIRDALVELADYLTDRDDYDIPYEVIRALCPAVTDEVREDGFHGLLLETVRRGPDRSAPLSLEAEADLHKLTGDVA
jgi:hypothetical protein